MSMCVGVSAYVCMCMYVCMCVCACARACATHSVFLHMAYHHISAADFGPWSSWGDCMCDLKRYRSRVCESEPCVGGDYVESEDCACVPLDAAGMCGNRINITTSGKHLTFNNQHSCVRYVRIIITIKICVSEYSA